jgi:hypothetical protein
MELILDRCGGASFRTEAQARRCTPADFDAMFALQNEVRAQMPQPDQYIPSTEPELRQDLEESLCIGIWAPGGELAAYSVLRYCGEGEHNYARSMDVPASDLRYWANGDSVVVAPRWRGNRLQRRLLRLAVEWRRPEIIGIGCTVSPENRYSLENLKAAGFAVAARRTMYGSYDRYVMRLDLAPLPGIYRHFKGGRYRVVGLATHSETREPMVVYRALYGEEGLWVRPARMWFEHVERDGYAGPRFLYEGPDKGPDGAD